jgi:hypothetical protein
MKRFSITASVLVCLCSAALFGRSETQTRTVYVSAVDKRGTPIVDLKATDLAVTEEGQPQAPITVERATTPMRIAVILDDRGLGVPEVRAGLSAFVETVRGHADVGVFSAVRPEATVVDFTADTQTLLDGIQQLLPMQTGGQGLSTLTLALAQAFEKQGTARPVIVVVTIDQSCSDVMGASQRAPLINAAGQTIGQTQRLALAGNPSCGDDAVGRGARGAIPPGPLNWQQAVAQVQRSRVTLFGIASRHTAPNDHNPVIDGSAEVSGGRVDPVLTDSEIPGALTRIAGDLLGQYAVTYNASASPKDGWRLRVAAKRPGLTVRAPERVGMR